MVIIEPEVIVMTDAAEAGQRQLCLWNCESTPTTAAHFRLEAAAAEATTEAANSSGCAAYEFRAAGVAAVVAFTAQTDLHALFA